MLGAEPAEHGILKMDQAHARIEQLIRQYSLAVDLAAKVESITVGMQQRVEILKMLYRDNDILIFDEPTAVLIPQEIEELMKIIRGLTKEGKSVLFISHKLRLTRKYLLERRAGIPPKCRSSKSCCNRCLESRAAPSIPWRKAVPWLPLSEMEHNMLYLIIAALSSSAKVSVQLEVFSTLSARCDAWLFYDYEPAFYKAQHRL